ncbi:Double-stranded RNA-binding protein 5 [Morus notabilis]|uniref:Double-stranded RNA-binding protein 5 n=1 Tax=Morus notabilis TaxID=981085 RepID=W9SV67_9ROSA|nr:double-stranded RNA-binding protein 3 [Morus notabilis]EXC29155.1 Double-stranded RNA-binding protein 5 [Morus notabilis]
MYKNQLQELAQRSCFNLPSYACIREGPDHAPRFKASVNFNGEIFESPSYCSTLRQAEHAAAEVALNVLSTRGPSRSLTARVLDETGIYKNLLQETAHRAGLRLPVYTTVRSGPGHVPTFTCTVELAGMNFTGESAKTKKQAEKNAAIAAWSALNKMPRLGSLTTNKVDSNEEQEKASVTRVLSSLRPKDHDGNKHIKRRDQNPPKRIFRSTHQGDNNHIPDERWKLMDLLMDLGQESSLQKHINSFASLLPPPPPRTASKILPPLPTTTTTTLPSHKCPPAYSSNRPIPVQVRSRSSHITPPKLDQDHQKDEEEWLSGKLSTYNTGKLATFGACPMASSSSSSGINKLISHNNIPRTMYTGQFPHPHRIAPAVQIRSVIPVCAAPPQSTTAKETSKSISNASSSSSTTSTLVSTEQGGGEVSSATSKFSKLQL